MQAGASETGEPRGTGGLERAHLVGVLRPLEQAHLRRATLLSVWGRVVHGPKSDHVQAAGRGQTPAPMLPPGTLQVFPLPPQGRLPLSRGKQDNRTCFPVVLMQNVISRWVISRRVHNIF